MVILSICFASKVFGGHFQVILSLLKLFGVISGHLQERAGGIISILGSRSENEAQLWSETDNLICLRHLILSTALSNLKF